jgi:hypothetical protein
MVNNKRLGLNLNNIIYINKNKSYRFMDEIDKEFKMIVFKIYFRKELFLSYRIVSNYLLI